MSAKNPAALKGERGFTLIDLLFTASLICTLATMALPGLMRARGVAQSASAMGTMRVINSAQLSYAVTCGSGFYSPDFHTLGVAPPASFQAFLPSEMTGGASFNKSGYTFNLTGTSMSGAPGSCNGAPAGLGSPGYVTLADPIDAVGNPHFYGSNADGTIYENSATMSGNINESGPASAGTPIH